MDQTAASLDASSWNGSSGHGPMGRRPFGDVVGSQAATRRQHVTAVTAMVLLALAGLIAAPFVATPLPPLPGYMTAFGSAMIVINGMLAALLFSKAAIEARGDAGRLGIAYLFVAVICIPLVACFPGGIDDGSLIGTAMSAVWLWSFWHAGFGLLIIRYAWLADSRGRAKPLLAEVAAVLASVALLTLISTAWLKFMPFSSGDGRTLFSSGGVPAVILLIQAVALALVCRLRTRTLERLWLTVAMVAALFDVSLTAFGSVRFSLGWYIAKGGSLATSLAIFVALLHEVTALYGGAAAANAELERLASSLARARDASERATRAKSQFLASMSHELRTPLNGILGYAELLHMDGGLSLTQSARVDAMRGAGAHLLEMIDGVLDLSQIEAERVELRQVEFDAQAAAAACVELMRPAAEKKGLALGVSALPGAPRLLVGDPTRLRQVLLNLVGNAVKFTAEGAVELRMRPAADGTALRIEVVDTGPGLRPDQRASLFQDFKRLGAADSIEGAGLGLALSSRLATLMGGRLGHDDNPAGGSVFWLEVPTGAPATLPIEVPPGCAAGPPPAGGAPAAPGRPPSSAPPAAAAFRVLVVDDVAMNREIACAFLRAAGHVAVGAEDGLKAVAAAAAGDFDAVLMDVRMPGMDGLEAARRIRALAGPRGQVPIVALTAQVFGGQVEECRLAGMGSHLGKPFNQGALLAAVSNAAERRATPARAAR